MIHNNCKLLPYIREDLFGYAPNMPQINGWQIDQFDIKQYWNESTGKQVTIAIIDTGCDYNHEDLKNNILDGINLVSNNNDPMDDHGHGTHVSSTIAAINNGKGIVGVAPEAKIIPIKALNEKGQGSLSTIAQGIRFAADRGVDFITMSLGAENSDQRLKSAIDYANTKGCVIFCAAGNSGPHKDIMYPAKYPNTISIGSIDRHLNRTNFTCSGDSLDFLAPGHDIVGCVPGNNYAAMSGTSMSNPFAVGLAALLLSKNKELKKHKLNSYIDYVNIFKEKTKDLLDPKFKANKKYQGYGIMYPIL
jgi:subtilisin